MKQGLVEFDGYISVYDIKKLLKDVELYTYEGDGL